MQGEGERYRTTILPVSASEGSPGPRRAVAAGPGVLVVASHGPTRAAFAALLDDSGRRVYQAGDPGEALRVVAALAHDGAPLDAIISEPEELLAGVSELLRQLRRDRPQLRIALVAGLGVEVARPPDLEILVLHLPFDTARLLGFIDELRRGAPV